MLSNSGETAELLELLPYLKQRNVPLIAILGNVKSSIAQRADVVIDASVDQGGVSAESRADREHHGSAGNRRRAGNDADARERFDGK